jgi:hypothetical protein
MTSGDSSVHAELLWAVKKEVDERIEHDPDDWWNVDDVANRYAAAYLSAKRTRAEAAILSPLSLTQDSFLARQQQMAPSLVASLTKELLNFEFPYTSAIVTGIDTTGAHIYTVKNGDVRCLDSIGFASIGIGSRHAESQFMFARHTPHAKGADTLLRVYVAKKRAEVAPGVGEVTDMFSIGPQLGTANPIGQQIVDDIDRIYQELVDKEKKSQADAQLKINQYVSEAEKKAVQQKQKPDDSSEADGEQAPPNGEAV